jgi:hypothetical protein
MNWLASDFKGAGSPYVLEFTTNGRGASRKVSLNGVEWADWDQRGRLVFARRGKICVLRDTKSPKGECVELADFNTARPEAIEAPPEAREW